MKKRAIITGMILMLGFAFIAYAGETMLNFKVTGMHCDMCPMAVEKAAKSVKGVTEVKLTLIEGKWENGGILALKADESVKAKSIISAIQKADKAYKAEEVKE